MKWIKCSDQLPGIDQQIIVYNKSENEQSVVIWEIERWDLGGKKPFVLKNCLYPMCKVYLEDITHWMPLPPEPGQEEEHCKSPCLRCGTRK